MSEEQIKWYRSQISKETLLKLTPRQNTLPFIHITVQLLFSIATAVAAYLTWLYLPWPYFILAAYIHCIFYGLLGPSAAVHELSHRTPFKTRGINEFFFWLCCFLTWTNGVKFRASHLNHHQYTVHAGRDLEIILPKIIKPWHWIPFFTFHFFSITDIVGFFSNLKNTVFLAFGMLEGEWEHRLFDSDPQNRRNLFNWARILLIGHTILAAVFIYTGLWPLLFLVTFAGFSAMWFANMFTIPQHIGLKPNVPDFRVCCRTMILNRFCRFFYWNMNYHIEHHMYPSVPFYNLPLLHEAIKSDLPVPTKGLIANWKHLLPVMQKQIKQPGFFDIPKLP
jgi:fatty acid desaturase